jgi:hypothetical protein
MSAPSICDDPSLTDDNIGNVLLIPAAILTVPSVITTGLRLLARRKALGRDDWTILIAACLVVVLNTLSVVGVQHGKGRHVCFLEDDAIAIIGKYSWTNQIVLFWALAFIKASVCLLILRVKSTAILRWISGVTIGLMFVSTVVACAALMAECKPISAYWNRSSGQCRPPTFRIYSIWVQACMCFRDHHRCFLRYYTKLTVLDSSCVGVDRSDMFPHAFPNPLEFTDSSSEEDWRGIVDGHGSSVCQTISDMIEQTTANCEQCIRLCDPSSSLPQSKNKRHNLSVHHNQTLQY